MLVPLAVWPNMIGPFVKSNFSHRFKCALIRLHFLWIQHNEKTGKGGYICKVVHLNIGKYESLMPCTGAAFALFQWLTKRHFGDEGPHRTLCEMHNVSWRIVEHFLFSK